MPEIAEVETVKNALKNKILHKRITKVKILYDNIIIGDKKEFIKNIENNQFTDIKRKGKWLIFELNDYYLLSHLRMEGKFFIKKTNEEILKHEHIIFSFEDNTDLRYHDTRKFGRMHLIKKEDLETSKEMMSQGIEPIDDNLTADYLLDKFNNKRLPIKTVLLDQSIISGLGNIYADEVLFASKINPLKMAKDISLKEANNIVLNSKQIINDAIKHGGTTIRSYTSQLGVIGNHQDYLLVHKKENKPCINCKTIIKRIKVNGRSTYYCLKCQK